ncbi:MAG: 3-deoxy-D-manno-octulosonic acid transferase [Alphaproteobacteria bacterium]|nr:3-deoxy-D-manno-octulosonic acid transferase [Alphaproteobacteria bacterium]
MSLALAAYRCVTWALGPVAGPYLEARARSGKEDAGRLGERLGRASAARPPGPVVWLHGASVGEMRVALQVQAALAAQRGDLSFLLTTGTQSSAALAARSAPPRTIHQFAPIDRLSAVRRFLDHWRPDLGIFAESDLWPNLITEARRRGVRLALVNGRMSAESLAGWSRTPAMAKRVLAAFDVLLTADMRTADGLSALAGRATPNLGNLKAAAPAPPIDAKALAQLNTAIGARPVWLAASTHAGEDEIVLAAHARLRAARPDALLVIAPRHVERGDAIAALAGGAPQRSRGETPKPDDAVYVADTMGEMGALYAACGVALVAGSLLPQLTGHNPIEPIRCGAAPLSGPHVESFADVFTDLVAAGAVEIVDGVDALAAAVDAAWASPDLRAARVEAGRAALARGGAALDATLAAITPLLPPQAGAHARA